MLLWFTGFTNFETTQTMRGGCIMAVGWLFGQPWTAQKVNI
jgi:hypothetical protein